MDEDWNVIPELHHDEGVVSLGDWLFVGGYVICLYQKVWDYRARVFRGIKWLRDGMFYGVTL